MSKLSVHFHTLCLVILGCAMASAQNDGRYHPPTTTLRPRYSSTGRYNTGINDGRYHPANDGRYIPDNAGKYSGDNGRYIPDNGGKYSGDGGQYVHVDNPYEHDDNPYIGANGQYKPDKNSGQGKGTGGRGKGTGGQGKGSGSLGKGLGGRGIGTGAQGIGTGAQGIDSGAQGIGIGGSRRGTGGIGTGGRGTGGIRTGGRGTSIDQIIADQIPNLPKGTGTGEGRNGFKILYLFDKEEKDGYHYIFETENGILAEEKGRIEQLPTGEGLRSKGFFEYTGDDGLLYRVDYVADDAGFVPQGLHLPKTPDHVIKLLKYLEEQGRK